MKRLRIPAGLLALVALGLVALFAGRPERAIRKALDRAVRAMEKSEPEGMLSATRRAERISGVFTEAPDIEIPGAVGSYRSRGEIRASVFQARALADRIRMRVEDPEIRLGPGRDTAVLTGTARATLSGAGETLDAFQEFEAGWVREKDGWRIRTLRARDAIRRPGA